MAGSVRQGGATGGQVLVVDDNVDHRTTVADILSLHGFDVSGVGSAEEARARLDQGPLPRVMVVDLLMPGEDGASLARHVLERHGAAGPRVVVVTGIASRDLRRLLPVDAVLFKPVAPEELVAAVELAAARP